MLFFSLLASTSGVKIPVTGSKWLVKSKCISFFKSVSLCINWLYVDCPKSYIQWRPCVCFCYYWQSSIIGCNFTESDQADPFAFPQSAQNNQKHALGPDYKSVRCIYTQGDVSPKVNQVCISLSAYIIQCAASLLWVQPVWARHYITAGWSHAIMSFEHSSRSFETE